MKQTILHMEMNYQNVKQKYEKEIQKLRRKLEGINPNINSPVSSSQHDMKSSDSSSNLQHNKFPSIAQHLSSNVSSNNVKPSMGEPKDSKDDRNDKLEEFKVQNSNDWAVVYNPNVKATVNINLLHNLDHSDVVCCVKFSHDGKKIATGTNNGSTHIFDVETGNLQVVLSEVNSSINNKEIHVRSVTFSPGKKKISKFTIIRW